MSVRGNSQTQPLQVTIWTIYENPSDYPGKFVVRAFDGDKPRPDCIVTDTLPAARASLPEDLIQLPTHVDDDPVIVETWI